MNESDKNWQIEHSCTQCGAPVMLEETDRLFSCSFCRTKLYLLPRDYFEYYLPPATTFSRDLLYVPYWRFKGVIFSCNPDGVHSRAKDLSSLATHHPFFPRTLGFRPQAMRLRFTSPEMGGRLFRPEIPLKTAIASAERTAGSTAGKSRGEAAFCEFSLGHAVSLIYAPVFIRETEVHDAILGKAVASIPRGFVDSVLANAPEDRRIRMLSTLCPHCGWDLAGERDSVVLLCRNCDSVWEATGTGLCRLEAGMIPGRGESSFYLPFWRVRASIQGAGLESLAGLLKVANVPRVPKEGWGEREVFFWAPAFKAPPEIFLRFARGLTLSALEDEFEKTLPGSDLSPVTLSMSEAEESIRITLAEVVTDKRAFLPKLPGLPIHASHHALVYLPFYRSGSEYVHSRTGCCLHQSHLRLGRHL